MLAKEPLICLLQARLDAEMEHYSAQIILSGNRKSLQEKEEKKEV